MIGKDVVSPKNGAGQSHYFGRIDHVAAKDITECNNELVHDELSYVAFHHVVRNRLIFIFHYITVSNQIV